MLSSRVPSGNRRDWSLGHFTQFAITVNHAIQNIALDPISLILVKFTHNATRYTALSRNHFRLIGLHKRFLLKFRRIRYICPIKTSAMLGPYARTSYDIS